MESPGPIASTALTQPAVPDPGLPGQQDSESRHWGQRAQLTGAQLDGLSAISPEGGTSLVP